MRPAIGQKNANIERMDQYIQDSNADLIVFGEMILTGYCCKDEFRRLAEPKNGPSIQHMQKIAKQTKKHIIFGMPLKDDTITGVIYNASVLICPDERVHIYRKWYLPTVGPFEEHLFFDQGETLPVFQTTLGTIALSICYDIYFPELFRAYALQGADLIVCISASPSVTRSYFEALLPARAIENTVYMIYANIVGSQEQLVFWGGSQAYDPLGTQLTKAAYFKESKTTCTIDIAALEQIRGNRPLLRDVRSELFNDLTQISRFHQSKASPPKTKK